MVEGDGCHCINTSEVDEKVDEVYMAEEWDEFVRRGVIEEVLRNSLWTKYRLVEFVSGSAGSGRRRRPRDVVLICGRYGKSKICRLAKDYPGNGLDSWAEEAGYSSYEEWIDELRKLKELEEELRELKRS